MHAQAGDWLVVEGRTDTRRARRAQILAVDSPKGGPPYHVRWLDDGRESLVFPGPDAHVVTAAEQAELDRRETQRVEGVQAGLADPHG